MDAIFSHDNADFDAAGSMLAASLLMPGRIPVLPKRMTKGFKAFYSLYKNRLPFRTQNHISGVKIRDIILTDTQVLPTHPSICERPKVIVVDHHPRQEFTPEDWDVRITALGACTSIWAEQLREQDIIPDQFHCTLMLMGIYDDTGFLSYSGTTPRDLISAAWLLSKGADLDLLREWLIPPLNENQIIACNRLMTNCETYEVHGNEICICEADLRDISDEFAPVAQRLRDMLMPDILVLLLYAKTGVRLICRNTSDCIDAGDLMRRFHGGGHTRAASGFVPVDPPEDIPQTAAAIREEILGLAEWLTVKKEKNDHNED